MPPPPPESTFTKIAYVGFGELGRQIADMLSTTGTPHERIVFDDACHKLGMTNSHPFEHYADDEFAGLQFQVCLGYKHLTMKSEILRRLIDLNRTVPAYVHPTAFVSPSATLGQGTVLYPLCNLGKEAAVGHCVLLNNSVTVSHNTKIGDGCYLSPGVVTSGFVTIGRNVFIGSGAVISNNVTIGDDAMVAIGTVVTRDVPAGTSAIGNPMRLRERRLNLA